MTIWVDADACPVTVKDILYRAASRTQVTVHFIANQFLAIPPSPYLKFTQVNKGFDIADNAIVERVLLNDLVITSDIPLAADVIAKGALVITPRGQPLTRDNIKGRLNMRDFLESLRASGIQSGGPPPLGQVEKQAFANRLDQYLAKHQSS